MEMENPFFTNRGSTGWYYPVYGVDPIHDHESFRSAQLAHRAQGRNSAPKVVQIPVHFVGSKKVDRTGSAVKIQKVFRGFFVRKCLKKVRDIGVQVDKIEEKLWKSEVVELVRRDEKERLRMNGTLMSLLFKLDSICGVDLGVRDCRKDVIRKVIALQERIDAIVASDSVANCENDDQLTEIGVSVESGTSNSGDVGVDCNDENHDLVVENRNDGEVKVQKQGNGDLLERMIEESEKMTRLIAQLNHRNEMQMKMLNALTNRVEMLEKAFVCDRLRKKKKKKANL